MRNTEADLPALSQPLAQAQIDAATAFWARGWETPEFVQLKQAFPERLKAIRIKAIVLNALYGTNVMAIAEVSERLERLLLEKLPPSTRTTGPALVEELVEGLQRVTGRAHYSFVAKYAHFFIDSNLPILDSYAEEMTAWHLGSARSRNSKRYLAFCENIDKLKELAELTCDCAQLDAYLWITGEYRAWLKNKNGQIDSDLRICFERLEKDSQSESSLRTLLGPCYVPRREEIAPAVSP